jgi:hypothetical protein
MAKQNHIFTKIRTGSQAEKLAEQLSNRTDQRPGKIISTISELERYGMGLRVTCTSCGANVLYTGRKLKDRFGATTKLCDIKEPCACGSSAVNRIPETPKS